MFTRIKTPAEIAAMRESGRMLASVLSFVQRGAEIGMSTKQLADMAAGELQRLGGQPAILGYQGFPDVICISVNDEVVHGIPSRDKRLYDGDVVSLDFCVGYQQMITDSALSFIIGRPQAKHQRLLEVTEQSLYAGIDSVHGGVRTGDIGHAVETVLNAQGYGVVKDLVGHGVGHHMHEDPNVPNYGRRGTGAVLKSGMTIAIEPMATLGSDQVFVADDGWTVLTQDGSWAAHFEHTILITEDTAEILTLRS